MLAKLLVCALFGVSVFCVVGLKSSDHVADVPAAEAYAVFGGEGFCKFRVALVSGCPGATGTCYYFWTGNCPLDWGRQAFPTDMHPEDGTYNDADEFMIDCDEGTCGIFCGSKNWITSGTVCFPNPS
jgi:hypothetical protein